MPEAKEAEEMQVSRPLFDFDGALQGPYPYGTKSAQIVSKHLVEFAWLIQKMNLPPESRILDRG